jgi:hypothetical protein
VHRKVALVARPAREVPDLFLTYMNHDRPRLIANHAGAHILNSSMASAYIMAERY